MFHHGVTGEELFQRRRERFSALNVVVELISTVVTAWIFFFLKLINCPACSDEPVTIFQYIIFLIQNISVAA